MTRLAIYFAPADGSELATFGEAVLGRDASACPVARYPDMPELLLDRSVGPAHYGFHATLKAPFELADTESIEGLALATQQLAFDSERVILDGLGPALLGDYLTLRLMADPPPLRRLAAECVTELERFRAPLSERDRQRRRPAELTAVEREYLDRYGYPHVMELFRFHMTLAGPMPPEQREQSLAWLRERYRERVTMTPVLDRLALYRQESRDLPFECLMAWRLGTGEPVEVTGGA